MSQPGDRTIPNAVALTPAPKVGYFNFFASRFLAQLSAHSQSPGKKIGSTNRRSPPSTPAEAGSKPPRDFRPGYLLAIELLDCFDRMRHADKDECSFAPGTNDHVDGYIVYRDKPPQNIVLEFIEHCADDRDVLDGFCVALTGFISSCKRTGVPDAELYVELIKECQHTGLPPSDRT